MGEAIGIRFDTETLKHIDLLTKEETSDRSTIIRKLITTGLQELRKEKASQAYRQGKITFSKAAQRAGITLWDFQHYLIDCGFVSSYSLENISEEIELLKKKK